ncbi:hypothetical protein [Streptomyces sp. LN500]|uniref:hypothetical protein n=1 Tax=Streptomyces sp. LN500 TaxID=3112978 RepID=UPI0037160365
MQFRPVAAGGASDCDGARGQQGDCGSCERDGHVGCDVGQRLHEFADRGHGGEPGRAGHHEQHQGERAEQGEADGRRGEQPHGAHG